ncbi:phage terminase large subunit [Sphingomonas sp. SRS2]|uniref:phage terminase large subunit n=1 Tax=Sphingomonas sp. SRS2 TaxID=133190 RepID=UPI00136497EA|nr:phage terminase large subunit [Sphingomonas sp. SRS2]
MAVAFPCWLLGRNPSLKIMVVTYSEDLSLQHAGHRRSILESDWYQRMYPNTRIAKRGNRQLDTLTTQHGRCLSASVTGTITGTGADFIILDDLMKADDANSPAIREKMKVWYDGTLVTRLTRRGTGSIISIQQRLHEDDLPAYLRDKGYECLVLPAMAQRDAEIEIGPGQTYLFKRGELLCPELFSEEDVRAQRIECGPQIFSAMYLQDPVAPEGNLIRTEHFRRFTRKFRRGHFDKVFQSWDTAASGLPTADWSVCTSWGYLAGRLFLLEILRQRLEYPELKRAVIAQRTKWRADMVLIELSNAGVGICQELRKNGPFTPTGYRPRGDKADRLIAQTGQIEEGRVWLPAELDGLDCFLAEMRAFPSGKNDDQVDSLTQMLEWLRDHWRTADTEYEPGGRRKRIIRTNHRPSLPPLPDWILDDDDVDDF